MNADIADVVAFHAEVVRGFADYERGAAPIRVEPPVKLRFGNGFDRPSVSVVRF